MKVAGRITASGIIRPGDPVPVARMAEALALYDEEALWDTSNYVDRTRPGKGGKFPDLPFVVTALQSLVAELAYIESVVGPEGFINWKDNATRRAQEIEAEQQQHQGGAS